MSDGGCEDTCVVGLFLLRSLLFRSTVSSLPGRTGGLFMHFWPMSLLPIWDRQCTYLLSYGLCYVSMESLFLSYKGLPICSFISEAVRVAWALGRLATRLFSFLLSVVQQPWLCHDCNSFALVTTWALSSSVARLTSSFVIELCKAVFSFTKVRFALTHDSAWYY